MSDIKHQIQQGLEIYSQRTVLRAVVNAIPWVGGSLDVVLSSGGQKIIEQRVCEIITRLKDDLELVKEVAIDREFLDTEAFFDLFRKALEASIKTRDDEKIKLYARILRNSLFKSVINKDAAEDYLSVLAELSSKELAVAKVIYDMQKDGPQKDENELQMAERSGWKNLASRAGLQEDEQDFILKRLERTGLIKEITSGYWDYAGGVYVITKAFHSMMDYIRKESDA